MPRNKPRGGSHYEKPDNQQERLELIGWIKGFVDGEGCFSVSIIRNSTTNSGWQVFPEFVVTQGVKSRSAIELIKKTFGCGQIYLNHRHDNHKEPLLRYCVRSQKELQEKIIPFFDQHLLQTEKRKDYQKFKKIIFMMQKGEHHTLVGLKRIAMIIKRMNRRVSSKFLKSSETIRQIPIPSNSGRERYSPNSMAT